MQYGIAEELGCRIVENGWRVVTGGLTGVMEAASRGAHRASTYRDGDVIGILPGSEREAANAFVDIVIPAGVGVARNVLVVQTADAVVAVGGGAGTLSEIALAWQTGRPIVAIQVEGWSGRLAGTAIDDRRDGVIFEASCAADAVGALTRLWRASDACG
jgi:uncharacterized protein (TIGR00725 family)